MDGNGTAQKQDSSVESDGPPSAAAGARSDGRASRNSVTAVARRGSDAVDAANVNATIDAAHGLPDNQVPSSELPRRGSGREHVAASSIVRDGRPTIALSAVSTPRTE